MKAIVAKAAGGPGVLEIQEIPTPHPAPGEVLIRVHASAVNGADLLQRVGLYSPPDGEPFPLLGWPCHHRSKHKTPSLITPNSVIFYLHAIFMLPPSSLRPFSLFPSSLKQSPDLFF